MTLCANKDGIDLTGLARRIAGAFDRKLGPPVSPKVMNCKESCYSVATTLDRLETFLRGRGFEISARIDHAAAAAKKSLEMNPAQVLIFGNPAIGTHLMFKNPSVAFELPLRVVVWQEKDGTVWAGSPPFQELAQRFNLKHMDETLATMSAGLNGALMHAIAPY